MTLKAKAPGLARGKEYDLSGVLEALEKECEAAARALDAFQAHSADLWPHVPMTPATTEAIQDLDRLTQTLDGLARALGELKASAPNTPIDPIPLSKAIGLDSLAMRIVPGGDGEKPGIVEKGTPSFF